jgi:hypothetical protein
VSHPAVAVTRQVTGRDGRVAHIPRPLMRFLSFAFRPIDRTRANQIATALTMDTRPMSADPATRTIAGTMTPATEVAKRLFGTGSRPPTGGAEHLIRF